MRIGGQQGYEPSNDERLPVGSFSKLFSNTSASYKFFWFKALFEKTVSGETTLRYEDLVRDMVIEAWYMVTEYHLNLGATDKLQTLVLYLYEKSNLKSNEKSSKIMDYIDSCMDAEMFRP